MTEQAGNADYPNERRTLMGKTQAIAEITPDQLAEALSMELGELCLFLAEEAAKEYEATARQIRHGDLEMADDHLERARAMQEAHAVANALWEERYPAPEGEDE